MQKKISQLSIFFPAYNEEENIETTVKKAEKVCELIADKYEIIVVNDGSKDKTEQIVQQLHSKNKNIKVISHNPNKGYGAALKTGMYSSQYEVIAFSDSDGQFDLSEIEKFIPFLEQYDLVVGYRQNRVEGLVRKLNAKAWGTLVNMLFQLNVRDVDCGFKVFKKSVLEKIQPLQSDGALISTEFLAKAKKAKCKIKEVPVQHYPRKAGKPTGANPKVILKAFYELFKLARKIT